MFRRTKSPAAAPAASSEAAAKPGGKGRPTPTRKEAEAAAKARAKVPTSRKEAMQQQRQYRSENSKKIRQAIKDGDERYLPTRDQGPVRRFVRDFVDSRLCLAEFAIPLLFASLLVSASGYAEAGSAVMNATMLMVVLDTVLLRFRLRRQLKTRFPGDPLKGTTLYAFMRSLQLRFLRLPKPQVKLGQTLPQRY